MRYAVVIEKGERNYSAYVPDLPGCVSVGDTLEEVKVEIREAIEFHLEGMREDGLPILKPSRASSPRGMPMALISSFEQRSMVRNSVHDGIGATYSTFERDGRRFIQD